MSGFGSGWTPIGTPPPPGGLGSSIIGGILSAISVVLESIGRALLFSMGRGLQLLAAAIKGPFQAEVAAAGTVVVALAEGELTAVAIAAALAEATPVVAAAMGAALIVGAAVTIVEIARKKFLATVGYQVNRRIPTFRISAEDGLLAALRGFMPKEDVYSDLRDEGVDELRANALIGRSYRTMGVADVRDSGQRGLITPLRARMLFQWQGLPDDQVDILMRLYGFAGVETSANGAVITGHLPTLSDLQHMVSRHIFDDVGRDLFKDPEATGQYYEYAALIGVSHDVAELFWLAHWMQIAAGQTITAWHRLGTGYGHEPQTTVYGQPLDREQVTNILRFHEIHPKLHDALIDSSWNGLSAFLIRGMIEAGTVDDARATQLMEWNQVKPDFIGDVLTWAHATKHAVNKESTKAELIAAYKDHILNSDELTQHLHDLGFTDDAIGLEIALADFAAAKSEVAARVAALKAQHAKGQLTDEDATAALLGLGKSADEVTSLLLSWGAAKTAAAPHLGTAELMRLFKNRILAEPDLRDRLDALHVPTPDAELLIAETDLLIADAAQKSDDAELRRQQKLHPVPTKSDLAEWLRRGIITPAQFTDGMLHQGFAQADIDRFATIAQLQAVTPAWRTPEGQLKVAAARERFLAGVTATGQLQAELSTAGVPAVDQTSIIAYETAALHLRTAARATPTQLPYQSPINKSLIATAKTEFSKHNITSEELRQTLLSAGMPADLAAATLNQELAKQAPLNPAAAPIPVAIYTTPQGKVELATAKEGYRKGLSTAEELQAQLVALQLPESYAQAIVTYELARQGAVPAL